MHLFSFVANNFRSFEEIDIVTPKGLILFLGMNGTGKTNALEAIYYTLTGKSFRTRHDQDLVMFGKDYFRTEASYIKDGIKKKVRLAYQLEQGKSIHINEKEYQRPGQLFFETHVVVFTPASSYLIKGGPGTRRHFLDRIKLKISPEYSLILSKYNQTLKSRNVLLKNFSSKVIDQQMYQVLTDELIRYSRLIQHERSLMVQLFNDQIAIIQKECPLENAELIEWDYQPFDKFSLSLHELHARESRKGVSLIGAHLDLIDVNCNGRLARDFSSEGEIKVMTIFSKLCEFETLEKNTKVTPVMILDDLSSELDERNLEKVLTYLSHKTQVFISSLRDLPLKPDLILSTTRNANKLCSN